MKLYFSPGACSLSVHTVLREAGMKFDVEKVSLADKKTENGVDYTTINPKGYVPALQLDNGDTLTEVPAILQYLADKAPEKQLAPVAGTMERYRLVEWLNFIATELHKGFSPLFKPNTPEETRQAARDMLAKRFAFLEQKLQDSEYLMGNQFTVADAYLFTVLNWSKVQKLDMSPWPVLKGYHQRVAARPAANAAMVAEGLIKG